MTTEDHNRTLGILHLVYGGLHALVILGFATFFIAIMAGMSRSGSRDAPEAAMFMMIFWLVFALFWLLFTIPSFVAGYGMLKKKSWAKVWSMIAGGIAGLSFPFGTALSVYTFWFLFSGGGKELYEGAAAPPRYGMNQQGSLYGAPQPSGWNAQQQQRPREYTYTPPPMPPDWRGE